MWEALAISILYYMILTVAAKQNPFRDPNICGNPKCDSTFTKFGFSNNIYRYEYSIDLKSAFSEADNNASSIFLQASVDIFYPKPCEGLLRIRDVKLWDNELQEKGTEVTNGHSNSDEDDYYGEFGGSTPDEQTYEDLTQMHPKTIEMANDLKKNVLRFSFHDGLIAELCPSSTESIWTLNFKRGILSAFQNTMLRFDIDHNTTEIDISGFCKVQYLLESTNDVFIKIRKTKDISTCRNRYSTHSILQSTPYNFGDNKAVWPLLDSKSHCDMIVNNNLYQEITCHEYHQLIAFSNNNTGAMTKLTSRLVLQEKETYSNSQFLTEYDELVSKRVTLLFDHTPPLKPTHSEIKLARDLLKDICSLGFPNIQREFINVFTNFIVTIKQLDYKALTQLLARSTSICEKGKYHILDSLPYIGNSASYQLMRDQLLTNSISKKMALNWLKSMAFIQHPDEDTVEAFYTILEFSRGKTEPEYTLSASAVIHSYCRANIDCSQNIRVKAITAALENEFINLLKSYRGERHLYERMIVNIKGLGNIGILSEYFVDQLRELIVNEFAPIGLRLESVFVFRRTDCIKYRSIFLSVYKNFTINSEVRIASYLQAMLCPDYFAIKSIKNVLKTEEVNQVGSFVWSHLRNLAKSSSPLNIEVQSLLFDNDISDKYNMDVRKFSRNFQHNFFFDAYDFGSTTDMNLIFGTESYLPRTMTLNLTTNIFGQSINFLELSARAVGFENIFTTFFNVDRLLHEYNYFNKNGLKTAWAVFNNWLNGKSEPHYDSKENSTTVYNTQNYAQFGSSKCNQECLSKMKEMTERRESLQSLIKSFDYKLNYDYNNPNLQLGLRIFGNDLNFLNLNGISELVEFVKEFDVMQDIYKVLSGKEVVYTKSNVFLEASYVVPLAVGLPLSIDVFGSSAIDLRVSGKLEQFSGWNFDIEGMIKPTILIDVVGRMKTDLFYTQAGIKVKSSLYSNSEVKSTIKVRGQSLVSFSFSLPQNRSELLSFRSEILNMAGNEDEPQLGIESRRANSTCTWPLLDTAIGLQICVDYSVPNLSNSKEGAIYPDLLLSGPLNFSIMLAKSDETAKTWVFEYTSVNEGNDIKLALLFFTPGSSFERSIVANVSVAPQALNASILFIHGNNKASVISQYSDDKNYRVFNFILDTNGNRSLDLKAELFCQKIRNIYIYKPKMLLAVNGVNITGAVGTVRFYKKNGVSQSDVDFSFETRKLQMLIRGIILQSEISKSANVTFNYRFQANKIESVVVEGRLINTSDKAKIEYDGKVKLRASAHPQLNFASNITWRSLKGHTEAVWACNSPEDFGDPDTTSIIRVLLVRSYSGDNIWDGSRSHASFSVILPRSTINTRLLIKHDERYKNGTEHNIIVGLRLNPEKEATLLVSLMVPRQHLLAFDAFFNISITRFNSCFGHLIFTEQLPKTYLVKFNGTWFTEQSVAITANYKDHNSRLQALKVIMESASFETISLYTSHGQNETLSYSNLNLKYGGVPYSCTIKTNFQTEPIKTTTCEIRIYLDEKKYWLNTSIFMKQPLTLQMELHLDKLRDIYLSSSAMYCDEKKELSVELNWDINRDPSQRLLLAIEYLRPNNRNIGKMLITYPDRTLSCSFNTSSQGPIYHGDAYVSWDMNELVVAKYEVGIIPGENINKWIHAEVYTSFNGWRKNTLDVGVYNYDTLYLTNMSVVWGETQNFGIICKYDVNIDRIPLSMDVRFVLNSSFIEISSVDLKINHRDYESKFVTDMSLRYNNANETFKIYSLESVWNLNKTLHRKNVCGTVLITSPHAELWRGYLVTEFILNDHQEIRGAASLTINLQEITFSVDGYVNKVNDNMILINITTPLNGLRKINGRFGFIEKKKYLVADIQTSSSALGIEALLDVISINDFDIILSVAIPFINLKQTAVFAKLKHDTIDMRVKWNNTIAGFIGVWYMNDLKDFEYSCKVLTPLKDFKENGYIVKFFKKDSIALTLYCKFSRYSLGVNINGKKKSLILKQLENKIIELEENYEDDFYSKIHITEYEEMVSYNIVLQMDFLIWPTIEGTIDVDQILDYYFAVADIKLPQGYIHIRNNLYYPDYLNIVNILNLKIPLVTMEEIKLVFEHHVDINLQSIHEKFYYVFNNANNTSMTSFKKSGCELYYIEMSNAVLPAEHYIKIMLALPNGEEINIMGKMHSGDNLFMGSLNVSAFRTLLELEADLEAEENFFEGHTNVLLAENSITLYKCDAYFKQDFSKTNNSLDIKFDFKNKNKTNQFEAQSVWQMENDNGKLTSIGKVTTSILPIKIFEYSFYLNKRTTPQFNLDLRLFNQNGVKMDYGLRTMQNDEVFSMEMWTPIQNFKNISIHGTLKRTFSDQYKIEGVLYQDMKIYNVKGDMNMKAEYLVKTHLQLQPISGRPESIIEINIKQKDNFSKSFEIQFNAMESGKNCAISGDYFYDQLKGLNLSMLVMSTEPALKRIYITSNWQYLAINHTLGNLYLETPWRDMGIENVKLCVEIQRKSDQGKIKGDYSIVSHKGSGNIEWSMKPEEDIRLLIESQIIQPTVNNSYLLTELKYINPNKNFKELTVGGTVNLNTKWIFDLNGTLNFISTDDIKFDIISHWPTLSEAIQELKFVYHGNLIDHGRSLDGFVEIKYDGKKSKRRGLTRLSYKNDTNIRSIVNVEWGIADNISVYQLDLQILKKFKARRELIFEFITPKLGRRPTLLLIGSYDRKGDSYHYANWSIDYPYNNRIADMDLSIKSLSDLNGYLNCTMPFLNSTWYKTALNFSTYGANSYRFCRVDWPSDFSFMRLHRNHSRNKLGHTSEGTIELEVPLNTRHRTDIIYNLNERPQMDNGQLKLFYNKKLVLNGIYKCKEQNSNASRKVTDITLENDIKPIGLHFVNSSVYLEDMNKHSSVKRIEIFDLDNPKKFNLTFELNSVTSKTKKDYKLLAVYPNRTVIFTVNNEKPDNYTTHRSGKIELSKAEWVGYHVVHGTAKTDHEVHNFEAGLSFPKRTLSMDGFYFISLNEFNLNMSFGLSDNFVREKGSLKTCILWRTESLGQHDIDNQTLLFTLGHYLLEKDITLRGTFYRGIQEIFKANVLIEYSENLEHLVVISTSLKNLRDEFDHAKYAIHFLVCHKASDVDVQFNGSITARSSYLKIESQSLYKKEYFPEKHRMLLALVDVNDKEIEYMWKSPYQTVRVWMQPNINYPVYGLNATLWNTPDTNNSGYMYIDFLEKEAHMYFNLTEDNTHNLIMYGSIPNARNIYIDIWRNYEELSIVDVASYLKLNHSRHVSGRFHWRPFIKNELKEKINNIKQGLLSSLTENIEFWTKAFYVETLSALSVAWETSKEYNTDFMNDIKRIKVLREDLEDFRVFVNKSYQADDFYIKTILNYTLTMADDKAFREHIGSLPIIFSEILQVLGETGRALRKSAVELIELINVTYNNIINAITNLINGDSVKYLTDLFATGFEKYEKIMKDLHISFINQTEYIWNKCTYLVSTYFKGVLKRIEPYIFKVMSFLEESAWDISKELFSLIYERTNELAESTYFNQISSVTQDIEKLYRDIKSNDIITNIKKYATTIWRFVKEKYHKLIPFGSELNEVIQELWYEFKELEKIKQIQVVVNKLNEFKADLEWIAEELRAKEYLNKLYALLRKKLHSYTLNALEVANMYREGKTKFIFDPEKGAIDFEQKLPMSWHAFNETPNFNEIAEYQMVLKIKKFLTANNISILRHIYDIRSYLDPKTWLPSHFSRALLVNTGFFITFDKRLVNMNMELQKLANCTYILSHDFWNNSFTLLLDLSTIPRENRVAPATKFRLIAKEHMFEIDLSTDTLTVNGDSNPLLPIKLNEVLVQRQSDILLINSNDGYKIECNMEFGLCWFELSGRYFGQTAGLLGTMNNEPFDDFVTPAKKAGKSFNNFPEAWSTNRCTKTGLESPSTNITDKLTDICYQLFSSLTHCVNFVDPLPFFDICVKSAYKSEREHLEDFFSMKASCTAAIAYIEMCKLSKIPMRVPQQCVFCELANGSFVPESTFVEYEISKEPRSSDFVFLLEAKDCSSPTSRNKSIEIILTALEEQLQEYKFTNNRFAVIAFAAQMTPFIISKGNDVFVSSSYELRQYFTHVASFTNNDNVSNEDSDVLHAISTASTLIFRPGVSKTFILLSCSRCGVNQVRFDYSSILQYMNEEGVVLHVLTYTDLDFDKPSKSRHLFGIDKKFAYSIRFPEGDGEMRSRIQMSKASLGICIPLALDAGGSVFSMNRTLSERKNALRRFATIFAKRVILGAVPKSNQMCECTGHKTGVAYIACASKQSSDQESDLEANDSDFSDFGWQSADYELE